MWKNKSTLIILAMILPDTWCSADNAGKKPPAHPPYADFCRTGSWLE